MTQKSRPDSLAGKHVREIRRRTRKQYSAESLYYKWSKDFLEAGKKRLSGDTARQAMSSEVKELRQEANDLKEALAETLLENRLLKKSMIMDGRDHK